LEGVRVLALEQMQALPYATQLLARLGADVVKVEPIRGESGRASLPAMTDPEGRSVGATFLRNNLNKRSISVDVKSPEGRDLVLRLARDFDVVAENSKPGTMGRLGLGYEDVAAVHPDVIYVSVSGVRQHRGDAVRRLARVRRHRRGHVRDLRVQAGGRRPAPGDPGRRPRRHLRRAVRHHRRVRRAAPQGADGAGASTSRWRCSTPSWR
jgi:crotonobetainyl-CoA:carnitine CoA-transferase CaiB-like acyl-CoA transferase